MSENQLVKSKRKLGESHNDPIRGLFWGILFIYTGILIFLTNFDYLYEDELYSFFFFGLGILMIGDYFFRKMSGSLRDASAAMLIFGLLFLIIGANHIYFLSPWWPVLFIIAGSFLILNAIRNKPNKVNIQNSQS